MAEEKENTDLALWPWRLEGAIDAFSTYDTGRVHNIYASLKQALPFPF